MWVVTTGSEGRTLVAAATLDAKYSTRVIDWHYLLVAFPSLHTDKYMNSVLLGVIHVILC